MSLNTLTHDEWVEILQFFSLDDLLLNSPEKLFGISSKIFSTFIGCTIQQFIRNDKYHHDGGLFYRLLNEKLMKRQLEQSIDRIVNRKLFLHFHGDYNEENNSHDIERSIQLQMGRGTRGVRVRRSFYTRSRLNVEPCGSSMKRLRSKLMNLIGSCHDQFPHVYSEYRNRVDEALKRSIKVCTSVNKPIENELGVVYYDNNCYKPNKPSIWDQSKREKSIVMDWKKPKVKYFKWRIQWAYEYRHYHLYELEYNLDHLKNTYEQLWYTCEKYLLSIDSINGIVSKFDQEFQKKFYTERNFCFKKRKSERRSRYENYPTEMKNSFIDFFSYIVISLSKVYNNLCQPGSVEHQKLIQVLERNMNIRFKYFENQCTEIFPNITIYHYLVRIGGTSTVLEKYFTPEVKEQIKNFSVISQQLLLFSLLNHSDFTHVPVDLVKLFNVPLQFRNNHNVTISIADILFGRMASYYNTSFFREWFELFIDHFGKRKIVEAMSDEIYYEITTSFSHKTDNSKIILEMIGDELEKDPRSTKK